MDRRTCGHGYWAKLVTQERRAAREPLKPESLWAAVGHAAPADTLWVSEAGSNEFRITSGVRMARLDKVRSAYDPDGRFHSWMGGV